MTRDTPRRHRSAATTAVARRGVALTILTLLAALLAASPASAQSKTQGSPLTAAANYQYGCETGWLPGYPPTFEAQPMNIGATSCTIYQSGTTTDDTHLVPSSGTVLSARVKSGANPAPLQITTMRRFFKPDSQGQMQYTCCQGISQTPTFQPTPNAVTEVPVNLLVSTQQPENGQTGWWDIVALSAVGPGTLPIADGGSHPPIGSGLPATFWYYPKVAPSEHNMNEWSASGFEVLMNYDWCPGTGRALATAAAACPVSPPRTPTPTPPTTPTPPVQTPPAEPTPTPPTQPRARARARVAPAGITSRQLSLAGSATGVRVACTRSTRCRGTVRLRTRGRRPALLASSRFTLGAGRTASVKLTLSRRGRRRLTGRRTRVRAEIDLGSAGKVAKNLVLVRSGR